MIYIILILILMIFFFCLFLLCEFLICKIIDIKKVILATLIITVLYLPLCFGTKISALLPVIKIKEVVTVQGIDINNVNNSGVAIATQYGTETYPLENIEFISTDKPSFAEITKYQYKTEKLAKLFKNGFKDGHDINLEDKVVIYKQNK